MQKKIKTVKTLLEALPFIKEFNNEIVVVKYGGLAQSSPQLKEKFAEDILLMYLVGMKPIIVHGSGEKITDMLESLKIEMKFVEGQKVISKEIMRISEMVLSGEINKEIVSLLNSHGAKGIGMSGKDAHFIIAKAKDFSKWGLSGNITQVKSDVLLNLIENNFIPVIAPLSASEEMGHPGFYIDEDVCAAWIAKEVGAKKIVFLSDSRGVCNKNNELLCTLTQGEVERLKTSEAVHGGMLAKVNACMEALDGGVEKAHIIDGRIEHSILLELFTQDGIGTQIVK